MHAQMAALLVSYLEDPANLWETRSWYHAIHARQCPRQAGRPFWRFKDCSCCESTELIGTVLLKDVEAVL